MSGHSELIAQARRLLQKGVEPEWLDFEQEAVNFVDSLADALEAAESKLAEAEGKLSRIRQAVTPGKLEWIAKWFDITDQVMAGTVADALEKGGRKEDAATLRSVPGDEVQNDLRAVAAILAASSEPEGDADV